MSRLLYSVVPSFAFFGPLVIVMAIPDVSLVDKVIAFVGGFMIALAFMAVLLRQREIRARLDALDGRAEAPGAAPAGVETKGA